MKRSGISDVCGSRTNSTRSNGGVNTRTVQQVLIRCAEGTIYRTDTDEVEQRDTGGNEERA